MSKKLIAILVGIILVLLIAFLICRNITFAASGDLVALTAERISDSTVEVKFQAITSLDKYAKYEVGKRDDGVYLELKYYKFPFLRGSSSGGGTAEIECPDGCKVFFAGGDGVTEEIFAG